MRYLTTQDVIFLHDGEVPEALLLHRGLLDSAVMGVQQSVFGQDAYPTVHLKAAALARGIVANHAFQDGNKRTALLAVNAFYGINGYRFDPDPTEMVHLLVDIVMEHFTIEKIATYFEEWTYPLFEPPEDRQ